jgi:AcrR family transcriptional regulator
MSEPGTRTSKAERSEATRAALIAAARELFAGQGFAATGTEQIVRRARVTRGALYHHFRSKEDLFRAVFETIEAELAERLVAAAMRVRDPLRRLQRGFSAFLDACLEPDVRQIVLIDGPAVLGWETWLELDVRHMVGLVEAGLQEAVAAGVIAEQPTVPLAHLLLGATSQAGMVVARDPAPERARTASARALTQLVEGLRRS